MKIIIFILAYLTAYICIAKQNPNDITNNIMCGVTSSASDGFVCNPGFEGGTKGLNFSGASGTITTTAGNVSSGKNAIEFDADTAAGVIQTHAYTVPNGLFSRNGVACIDHKGSGSDYSFTVSGTDADPAATVVLADSTGYTTTCLNFIFPASGYVWLKIDSNEAATDTIYIDNMLVADANRVNISQISQAEFYGSVTWVGTTNCTWDTNSGTFAGFSADADCTTPTGSNIKGNASAPDTKIPAIKFSQLPIGEYYIVATGRFIPYETAGTSTTSGYRFSDGTNVSSSNIVGSSVGGATSNNVSNGAITGHLSVGTAISNATIEIQAILIDGDGTQIVASTATTYDLTISVYRFPTSSQTAYSANTNSQLWNGVHGSTCLWSTTSSTYVLPTGDASCVFTEDINKNIGTVSSIADGTGNQPSITFTPTKRGAYLVCYHAEYLKNNSTGVNALLAVYEDSTILKGTSYLYNSAGSSAVPDGACFISEATDLSAKTYELQLAANGAQITYLKGRLFWQIARISENFPMPQTLNNVESSASGGVRTCSGIIATGTTVSSEEGDCIASLTDNADGDTTVTFTSGVFSSAPWCTCSGNHTAPSRVFCTNDSSNGTATTQDFFMTNAADGTGADRGFSFICIGSK